MDPTDYLKVLVRRWPFIAIGALLGAVFAFVGTDAQPQPVRSEFRATHTLLTTLETFGATSQVGTVTFAQVPVFATTGEVPRLAAESLGWTGPPAALAAQVVVESDPTTGTIRFSTTQENPDDAVRISNAFADETVEYLTTRQEEQRKANLADALADVENLEAEIEQLDGRIARETAAGREPSAVDRARRDTAVREYSIAYETFRGLSEDADTLNLTTLERAQPVPLETGGFTPPQSRSTRVPIAALIGALLGAGVALVVDRLDSRLRDRRRAEEAFGSAVVAELPTLTRKQKQARIVVGPEFHDTAAESYRSLRTSLTFMAAGGQPQSDNDSVGVILVTSPSPAEGKTTTSVNLAAAFAETGRSVIIVNSDFRRPMAVSAVIDDRPPLPAGLAGISRLEATEWLTSTNIPGVALLDLSPLGGTPGDLTRATLRLVSSLKDHADVVIIDTPPLAVTTEALEFVPIAKVVVLVGRLGHTATESAQRAGELIKFGGAEEIAITLTDTGAGRGRRSSYYYYYDDSAESAGVGSRLRSTRRKRASAKNADKAAEQSNTQPPDEAQQRRADELQPVPYEPRADSNATDVPADGPPAQR